MSYQTINEVLAEFSEEYIVECVNKAALSQHEAEPVAYLWGGVLIRADETHPCHRREGAPLYRHQPKSLDQSPVAYSWDDNNGFGGSPSRRVGFEYPQYFHGPVTKLYDHASPIDVKTIMAELRAHCESNNELVPEQSIDDTLLSTEKMMGREAPKPASRPIEPSPQPVASVPQDVEEFTWANFVSYLIDNCEGEAITEERLQHALSDMMAGVRYCPSMPTTHREAELKGVVVNNNLGGDQILLAHPPHTTIPIGTVMIACSHPDVSHDCCVVCGKNIMPNKPDFEWLAAKEQYSNPQPKKVDAQVESWRHDSEEVEALHMNLDDAGVPRHNEEGAEYSSWGRVCRYVGQPVPQSVEEFIAEHQFNPEHPLNIGRRVMDVKHVRALMAGKALVPVEPTREMIARTVDAVFDGAIEDENIISEIYSAMLTASKEGA